MINFSLFNRVYVIMKTIFLRIILLIIGLYGLVCVGLYFFQEKLLFFPQKLEKNYRFDFSQDFEELTFQTHDNVGLNALLFKAKPSKGLIFYLHGNSGSLQSWGALANTYTHLDYDVLLLDYRGFGKSEGFIAGQEQFFQDVQTAYDEMKKRYAEDKIIVLGYSIGTGPAAKVASTNAPKLLILQAPYYSLVDMMRHTYAIIPTFILKYKFETNEYLKSCKAPIVIFHGDQDEVIYFGSSLKLKEEFKADDQLIVLPHQRHNGITYHPKYQEKLTEILSQ